MPDNNAAIILTLILVLFAIAFAVYMARKWITSFTRAIAQAKEAEREASAA